MWMRTFNRNNRTINLFPTTFSMKRIFNVAVVALIAGVMAVSCFNGSKSMVTKGDSSKLDTLSYAMGANLGEFLSTRLADLPFNYEQLEKGLQSAALGKAKWSAEQAQEVFQSLIGPVNDRFGQLMRQKQDTTATVEPIQVFERDGERDSLSYAYGINIGNDLRQGRFPIQMHWYMKGEQQTRNCEGLMSSEEIAQFLQNYFMVVYPQQEQEKSSTRSIILV